MPNTIEDYVHRIGRTGRAGRSGCAVSFFGCDFRSIEKVRFARRLVKVIQAGKRVQGLRPKGGKDFAEILLYDVVRIRGTILGSVFLKVS